jgi:hypothetical protein
LAPDAAVAFLTRLGDEPEGVPHAIHEDVDPDGKVALKISGTIDRVLMHAAWWGPGARSDSEHVRSYREAPPGGLPWIFMLLWPFW